MSAIRKETCKTCGENLMCPGHYILRERLYTEGTFKPTDQHILKTDGLDLGRRRQQARRRLAA